MDKGKGKGKGEETKGEAASDSIAEKRLDAMKRRKARKEDQAASSSSRSKQQQPQQQQQQEQQHAGAARMEIFADEVGNSSGIGGTWRYEGVSLDGRAPRESRERFSDSD